MIAASLRRVASRQFTALGEHEAEVLRSRVSSSVLAAVAYDPEQETLEVQFRRGRRYRYVGVPRRIYDELLAAPSKGEFFNERIRDVYRFTRIR